MVKRLKKPEYLKHTYICLLAGGTGTRLWPRSRKKTPKQFAPILGRLTLFQQTVKRIRNLVPLSRVYVITNERYTKDIQRQIPLIPNKNIIAEPEKKNTAMAMGVAAAWIHKKDPKAVVINLAADHLIQKPKKYIKVLKGAAKTAFTQDKLVAVGVVPTFPHTGLGYIHFGKKIPSTSSLPTYKMKGFTEKPNLPTAKRFLKTKQYLWNANNYVYTTKRIIEEFKIHAPDIYRHVYNVYKAVGTKQQNKVLKKEYRLVREDSIDYAISEKTKEMIVIPGDFGWRDIGDWKIIYDISKKDKNGNVVINHGSNGGEQINLGAKNNLIHFDDQLIATVGVENLIIVDTGDALLICNKDKAQNVKELVKLLKEKKNLSKYV
jgi:mannose-1-phosphate guanylyltransferase